MRTSSNTRILRRNEAGLMLVECLVYLALWAAITGVAFSAFYRALDNSKSLRRNSDDITRVLHAGEIWRQDVRGATGPIQIETVESGTAVQIPQNTHEVMYLFTSTNVLRASGTNSSWMEALNRVKSASMTKDSRRHVTAWRWDLELVSTRKNTRIPPLFTFEAVPGFQEKL